MPPKFLTPLLMYIGMVFASTSKECQEQLQEYELGVKTNQRWALQMMDATAKGPAGVLSGNLVNLGMFEQCLATSSDTSHGIVRGKYCLGFVGITFNVSQNDGTSITLSKYFDWGVCIPELCTMNDSAAVNPSAFLGYLNANITSSYFGENFCQTLSSVELSSSAVLSIAILCIILGLVICSTVYEYCTIHWRKQPAIGILVTFSAIKNGKQLVDTIANNDQILCLNGLRVISLLWIMLYHEYSTSNEGSLINLEARATWLKSFSNFYVLGASYAVDTFFVMGGLLVGYHYQRSVDLNKPFRLFKFYMHRILRIVPSLAVLLMVNASLVEYLGSGPYWPKIFKERDFCTRYWWSTLLFVQNYVNPWKLCLNPTWYLNVDMQLYVLSPIILLLYKLRRKATIGFTVLLILASIAVSFSFFCTQKKYEYKYYLHTHARAPCWLIGLLVGLELNRFCYSKYRFSNLQVFSLWATSLTVLFISCSFLSSYGQTKYVNSFFLATSRPAWAIAICWIIIACVTGNGGPVNDFLSLPVFQTLSKLTYNMFLIHRPLMLLLVYQTDTPYEFSQLRIAKGVWGNCMFSMFLALIMVLAVEYPIQALEKILLK